MRRQKTMPRRALAALCAAACALSLAACAAPGAASAGAASSGADGAGAPAETPAPALRSIQSREGYPYAVGQNGFFEDGILELAYSDEAGRWLHYRYDFETMRRAPLCAVEGCSHTTDVCPAVLPQTDVRPSCFYPDETHAVFFLTQPDGSAQMYTQTLDGASLPQLVYTFGSSDSALVPGLTAAYTDGESLYYMSGGLHFAATPGQADDLTAYWFVRMSFADGAVEPVYEFGGEVPPGMSWQIAGDAAGGKAVALHYNSTAGRIDAYDAIDANGEKTPLWTPPEDVVFQMFCEEEAGPCVYYMLETDGVLRRRALPAGEEEAVTDALAPYASDSAGVRLRLCALYENGAIVDITKIDAAPGEQSTERGYLDFSTGALTPSTLLNMHNGYPHPVSICCVLPARGQLVVQLEEPYTEHSVGSDGQPYTFESSRSEFALIDFDDWLAGEAAYRTFS